MEKRKRSIRCFVNRRSDCRDNCWSVSKERRECMGEDQGIHVSLKNVLVLRWVVVISLATYNHPAQSIVMYACG